LCEELFEEMKRELGIHTVDRLADYVRLRDDASYNHEQKLSLAFSGWLLGGGNAVRVRQLIHQYINEPVQLKRDELVRQLGGQEGASPQQIARLVAHMKPPLDTPGEALVEAGLYKLSVPVGVEREPDVTSYVQLPPEYDPLVRYPAIVTLNGAGTTPENQLDWWAGARGAGGNRLGQATRHGYIVIAVDWLREGQQQYEYSAREHGAVLGALRDACRRFSIDTDRVFISGHSIGGTAAWDLALAHPDLWCGAIPIVAKSDRYCAQYWQNARLVPFYVVQGELDGDLVKENARDLDRYMIHRFDVTVVEFQGRGHEDYYEEIQKIFDWMGRRESRNFFPKEFTVSTMRAWDNFFWWLEVTKLPPRSIVAPSDWPPKRGVRPAQIDAKVQPGGITIRSGGIRATVWLAPEIADPAAGTVDISLNGRATKAKFEPNVGVLLEDVRTRGDRLHPFWAKVEL
jgi:predicted esterase